jgi:hypothetical protein
MIQSGDVKNGLMNKMATVSESGRILTGLPDSVASVSEPGASSDFSVKRIQYFYTNLTC